MNILQDTTLHEYREMLFRNSNQLKLRKIEEAINEYSFDAKDFIFIQNIRILRCRCKLAIAYLKKEKKNVKILTNELHILEKTLEKFSEKTANNDTIDEYKFQVAIIAIEKYIGFRIDEKNTSIYYFLTMFKQIKKEIELNNSK